MNIKKIISSIGIGAGAIILGLGIQYVLAQTTGTWSPAGTGYPAGTNCTPPNCNTAAPINVSGGGENGTPTYPQTKTGFLTLANFIFNPTLTAGSVASSSVLAAIGNDGVVGWMPLTALAATTNNSSIGNIPNMVVFTTTSAKPSDPTNTITGSGGSYTWTVPDGVTKVRVRVVGGGGAGVTGTRLADGGAGGYAQSVLTVVPGQSYSITVGAGGSIQPPTGYYAGQMNYFSAGPGGQSSFSGYGSTVSGTGGDGAGDGAVLNSSSIAYGNESTFRGTDGTGNGQFTLNGVFDPPASSASTGYIEGEVDPYLGNLMYGYGAGGLSGNPASVWSMNGKGNPGLVIIEY